jgi:hypothetical protein
MSETNIATFGIFHSRLGVDRAVESLKLAGFSTSDVSVLMSDKTSTREFAHEKNTKAPEGATAGAGTGVLLGGALGWAAGIGALAIPGVGPLVAAGPIMAALAGAGIGGTVGGLSGAIIGFGIPEYEAKRYEGAVKDGGTLLSVHCASHDLVKKAKEILQHAGAEDIASSGEATMNTYKAGEKTAPEKSFHS